MTAPATSITVHECRAMLIHEQLTSHPEVRTIEEARGLPRFAGWVPTYFLSAIDVLIARGALAETADGVLELHPWSEPREVSDDERRQTTALRMLRRAGRRGVPYVDLRDALESDHEAVLGQLRAAGHTVQRTPSEDGILAVLINDGGDA